MNIPKIESYRRCGKKPKEQIWSMSYGNSGDEFYLQHWCNSENKKVYFPKLKENPHTAYYVNGQRPRVIMNWNEIQLKHDIQKAVIS